MHRRALGTLQVSVLGVGCNQFGPTADEAATAAIVGQALDSGVNFFDTADEYGPEGLSEEYLGRALRGRRDEAVIATKFGHHMDGDPARGGASARWIVRAVEDSLRRLGTDRIDLYQQHFPDSAIAAEETMAALDSLVRSGKILHHGVCNLEPSEVNERCSIARAAGISAPVSSQNRYNLLRQEASERLIPTLEANGLTFLPYFPLASGMLTGKYRAGQPLPEDSRFGRHLEPDQARHIVDRDSQAVERLSAWASDHGHSVAELALAWLASQPVVASVIAGVTKPAQVEANVRAVAWELTPEELSEAGAAAAAAPGAPPGG